MKTLRYALIETQDPTEVLLLGTSVPRIKDATYYTAEFQCRNRVIRVESRFKDKIHSELWKIAIRGAVAPVKGIGDRPSIWIKIQGLISLDVLTTRLILEYVKTVHDGFSYRAIVTIGSAQNAGYSGLNKNMGD